MQIGVDGPGGSVNSLLRQATGYSLASAVALATDVAILITLVEQLHWHYLIAATASFVAGATVAYVLVTRFVFHYRRVRNRRVEFAIFAGLGLIGLVVNGATIYALVEYLALPYLAAKAAAASLTFFTNFIARRWLLFTHWSRQAIVNPGD
jgi:putative flippase GtrA